MRSRRIFVNMIGWAVGGITGVVAMMLVAEFSGPEVLGVFAYGLAFFNTFAFPSTLDIESAHLRILPTKQGEEARARAVGAFAAIRIGLNLIAFATLFIAVGFGFSDTINENKTQYIWILIALFASSALLRIGSVPIVTFAANGQTAKQQVSLTIGKLVRNLCLAGFGVLALGAVSLSLAYLAGGALTCIAAFYLFRGYGVKWPHKSDIAEYLGFSAPMMAAPIFSSAIMSVDKLFVGEFWGETQLGVYYLAQSLAVSLLFIDASVRYVFIPGFVKDIQEGKIEKVGQQARKVARFIYLGCIPLIFFVWFFGDYYFEIVFGEEFGDAAGVLAILLVGIMASMLADPLISLIVAEGKSRTILASTVIGLACTLIMLVLLVPPSIAGYHLPAWGIIGAAVAVTTAFSAELIYYRAAAKKITAYISPRHFLTVLSTSAVAAIALELVPEDMMIGPPVLWIVLVPLLFASGTLAGLVATRAISREDLRLIIRVMSPRETARYIRDEMKE